ncbi:unnamed protein product, partial [Brassica rapa]
MGSCIYRLHLTVTCAFTFSARFSASSSSSGAPVAFVDPCLSHFGECLTELASSYSLDGLVTLVVRKCLG